MLNVTSSIKHLPAAVRALQENPEGRRALVLVLVLVAAPQVLLLVSLLL